MSVPIRIVSLDCWCANGLLYQADGRTDDGKHVFVHARGTRFSVWVGDGPYESCEGTDIYFRDDIPGPIDTSAITLATLKAWTPAEVGIEWPGKIDGYDNESGPLPR